VTTGPNINKIDEKVIPAHIEQCSCPSGSELSQDTHEAYGAKMKTTKRTSEFINSHPKGIRGSYPAAGGSEFPRNPQVHGTDSVFRFTEVQTGHSQPRHASQELVEPRYAGARPCSSTMTQFRTAMVDRSLCDVLSENFGEVRAVYFKRGAFTDVLRWVNQGWIPTRTETGRVRAASLLGYRCQPKPQYPPPSLIESIRIS